VSKAQPPDKFVDGAILFIVEGDAEIADCNWRGKEGQCHDSPEDIFAAHLSVQEKGQRKAQDHLYCHCGDDKDQRGFQARVKILIGEEPLKIVQPDKLIDLAEAEAVEAGPQGIEQGKDGEEQYPDDCW